MKTLDFGLVFNEFALKSRAHRILAWELNAEGAGLGMQDAEVPGGHRFRLDGSGSVVQI